MSKFSAAIDEAALIETSAVVPRFWELVAAFEATAEVTGEAERVAARDAIMGDVVGAGLDARVFGTAVKLRAETYPAAAVARLQIYLEALARQVQAQPAASGGSP